MTRMLLILIIVSGMVGGVWWFSNIRSAPVTTEIEQQLKQKAVAYLSTYPEVADEDMPVSWQAFFVQSSLVSDEHPVPDSDWFLNHKPYIETRAGGGYRVSWVGLPGCESQNELVELVDFSAPQLFDNQGVQCFSWWRFKVLFDDTMLPEKLLIDEMGAVEGSTG